MKCVNRKAIIHDQLSKPGEVNSFRDTLKKVKALVESETICGSKQNQNTSWIWKVLSLEYLQTNLTKKPGKIQDHS